MSRKLKGLQSNSKIPSLKLPWDTEASHVNIPLTYTLAKYLTLITYCAVTQPVNISFICFRAVPGIVTTKHLSVNTAMNTVL